jgi:hypothetical protein
VSADLSAAAMKKHSYLRLRLTTTRFCQGLRIEVYTHVISSERMAAGTSMPFWP